MKIKLNTYNISLLLLLFFSSCKTVVNNRDMQASSEEEKLRLPKMGKTTLPNTSVGDLPGALSLDRVREATIHQDLPILNEIMSIVDKDIADVDHFNKLQEFKDQNGRPAYVTIGHEALHVLHQQLRSRELFARKVENESYCFYSVSSQGFCMDQTGLKRADIFDYLPEDLREVYSSGTMSDYVIGTKNLSSLDLLQLFDEWVAYVEEMLIAMNVFLSKDESIVEKCSALNPAAMTMYNIAALVLIHERAPDFIEKNPSYLKGFKFLVENFFQRADEIASKNMSFDDLDGSTVKNYFNKLSQSTDSKVTKIKEVIINYYGQEWFDRYFNRT